MQLTQIDNSPMEKIFTTKKVSMPTLIEEIKPVIWVKDEFEYREKLNLKCLLRKFRTIKKVMQRG